MQYLLLLYDDEQKDAARTEAEAEANMNKWFAYDKHINEAVTVVGGNALQPTGTATTVRKNAGGTLVSDGPFAETKEQLGGYYLIEAENLDQAIEIASGAPHLEEGGSVEIRPIMEFA